jgi:hypothetical protein
MAPQRKVFSKSFDLANMSVTISTPSRSETYLIKGMSEDIRNTLMLHGLTQKLSDKCAASAGALTEDEKWTAMNEVYASLHAGTWSLKSEGQGTMLVRALMELAPNSTLADIRAKVEGWSNIERRAVSANPKVATILRRMEAERASGIDSDELLDNLLG